MDRRLIAGITLLAYCFWIVGCATTTKQTLIRDELPEWNGGKIVEVMVENGDVIRFDEVGGRLVSQGAGPEIRTMILGYTWDKRPVEIDARKVLKLETEKSETNAVGTLLLVFVGLPAAALGFLILYFIFVPIH